MTWRARMFLAFVIACLSAVCVAGIDWGLPSRSGADPYLFASHTRWSGQQIASFDVDRTDNQRGADVDRDPVDVSRGPVVLNSSDADRAQIIRRYRLFSSQPDEMITFMALQQMRPGDMHFDPRLYQYGGMWIYPVGAMLKVSSILGWVDLRSDAAFYYDHPEAFGRFYIVARIYTLMWYAVLLWAVAVLVKRITGDDIAAIAAAALVGICPVVFAMAHEAKPHLPGAALMVLTCIAGIRYVDQGCRRDAIVAGIVAGLSIGMVLSSAIIGVVLIAMVLLRRVPWPERAVALSLAIVASAISYAMTNPYVPINLIFDRAALVSNLANTRAMYGNGTLIDGLVNGSMRLMQAASIPVLILTAVAIVGFVVKRKRPSAQAMMLIIPVAIVLMQFLILADNKPAEYGRFSLFAVVGLAVASAWGLSLVPRESVRASLAGVVFLVVGWVGTMPYVTAFSLDARSAGTRSLLAIELNDLARFGKTLSLHAEPAPYTLAPIDLWRWRVLLEPKNTPVRGDVFVRPYDTPADLAPIPAGATRHFITADAHPAPITWANKPFEILIRD
jgi:hypothetical protein